MATPGRKQRFLDALKGSPLPHRLIQHFAEHDDRFYHTFDHCVQDAGPSLHQIVTEICREDGPFERRYYTTRLTRAWEGIAHRLLLLWRGVTRNYDGNSCF